MHLSKICSLALSVLAMSFAIPTDVSACTGIKLVAKDGSFVHGRTLEFGIQLDPSIVVVPRGYEFKATNAKGTGFSYKTKYASVGAITFDQLAMLDGLNEKGLAVGTFYFPGYAKYADLTPQNQANALSAMDFPNWILTQFATVEEVKDALAHVVIVSTIDKQWGDQPQPFHYIVYDKSGKSIVIEPLDGKLVTYENKLGVLTNSPDFAWHTTNLRNFINLTPFNVAPIKLDGVELTPFGQGSGMVGLPGDFTPPSRFVRAAIFQTTATPSKNSEEAIFQAFHILNQFDIPVGTIRQKDNGVIHTDATIFTVTRDPQTLKYYFRSYEDQSIRMVDLSKFDFNAKDVKKAATTDFSQPVIDFTSNLK